MVDPQTSALARNTPRANAEAFLGDLASTLTRIVRIPYHQAQQAADELRQRWAGHDLYIPATTAERREARNAGLIRDARTGMSGRDLMRNHHLGKRAIQQVLKEAGVDVKIRWK